MRKPTIYEVLREKLGHEPTHRELCNEVKRILEESLIRRATAMPSKGFAMIGFDAWLTHNPYDNELGSIQDDEPIEEEKDVDDEAFAKAIENMENCKREMTVLEDRLDEIGERLAMTTAKLRNAIIEATAHLNQEIPYRDAKFNESTNRYGKGW